MRLHKHWEASYASRQRAAHVSDHIQGVGLESVKKFANPPNQIQDSPEYDPARFDEDYRTRLGTYYDPFL